MEAQSTLSSQASLSPTFRKKLTGLLLAMAMALPSVGSTATINKANNTTGLNNTGSWTGGALPTATDIAQWTNAVAAGNSTVGIGGNVTFGQIRIVDPNAAISITGSNTLTLVGLGGVGIDMTSATQNLLISPAIALSGSQSWEIAAGRTLTMAGAVTNNGHTLSINGAGNLVTSNNLTLNGSSSLSGSLTVKAGTFALTGTLSNITALTINSGTLVNGDALGGATTNRLNPGLSLVMGGTNGSATYTQTAATSGVNSQTFTGLHLKTGVHTINSSGASASVIFSGASGSGYLREAGAFINFGNNSTVSFTQCLPRWWEGARSRPAAY